MAKFVKSNPSTERTDLAGEVQIKVFLLKPADRQRVMPGNKVRSIFVRQTTVTEVADAIEKALFDKD